MAAMDDLIDRWNRSDRVIVLSGAGMSTESGIPAFLTAARRPHLT